MKFEQFEHASDKVFAPDYAYAHGLRIKQTVYNESDAERPIDMTIAYDQLLPPPHSPERTARPELIVRSIGKTAIAGQLIRSASNSRTLNLIYMGWGGNISNPIAQGELELHAMHNPNADTFQISNPGHGGSSPLPRSISRSIAESGHFRPQGEMHAELIGDMLDDYDDINISGQSYGGRQAIALASALDRPVKNLHLLDPPGSRDLGGLLGIGKAFMSLEGSHAAQYQQYSPDRTAADVQRLGDSTPLQDVYRLARSGGLFQQFFDQTRAMAKKGLEHDLALACPNVRNTIKFTSPELSELNYVDDVSGILKRIANVARPIQHNIILDHSHTFIAANPRVSAYEQRFASIPSESI